MDRARIIATLMDWPAIIGLGCALAVLAVMFALAARTTGGKLLDGCLTHQGALRRLNGMSPAQRGNHFVITLTLDTLYPFVYGALFAGLVWRFSAPVPLYAAPIAATMIADFGENIAQLVALSRRPKTLVAKTILTWLKFGLMLVSGLWIGILVAF